MTNSQTTKKNLLHFILLLVFGGLFSSSAQEVAPFTPRLDGGNIEIRGDIIFVGNNILNRATESNPEQADTPYNGTQNNNSLWMEYIDIDSDPSTFSSSSAELNIADPACSQVRYAGLYWAATYPNERSTNGGAQFSGTPRIEDWFNVRFQVPGGTYVDLTADTAADPVGQEDDIIYDGYNYTNINNSFKDSPYICYKNVTDLVRSNTNPNGEYTVANVRATKGRRNGSSSAGWVLVIIYENPNESGKFISTFDGYAGMSRAAGSVDVPVNGFRTLPTPFPVRARVGVGALEGDRGIRNDRFFIRANSNANFTNLSTGLNPTNNFFNSTITTNGAEVPTRTPFGTNTLGTDLDLFNLNNPTNSVLPNSESGATLRFTSTGDGYGAFLAAFAVEIIEPNIILEKRVEDIAGNDITGMGVNLGQTLDYVLSFRNLGNDDAENYTIRDVLPVNTTYVSFDVSNAPGVTNSVDPVTNEVTFFIPDELVEIGDPIYEIRMRVRVAENCFDFVDACTDQIENIAYSTYRGDINSATITDDPSVSDFDNCGFVTPGATNFLLDNLSDCNFTRTAQLCGESVVLDAGDNFDDYVWVRDSNGNGQFDVSDTVLNDGDPDNDPSTLVVTDIGTYIVDKIVADPCKGFKEIIIVERFGTTQTNPLVDFFNDSNSDADPTNDIQGEIAQCSIDGDLLPKIFLCGANDSELIQINITDAQSLVWEQLDEASCTAVSDDCANKDLGCSWNAVGTGNNFTTNAAGKFRLVINYTNGCFSRFYFDVYQNNLDIVYNQRDIVCSTDGNITVTNLGSNYGYQLVDVATNSIVVPFSSNNGPSFDITTNGAYRVEVVQLDGAGIPIPNACIFSTPDIGILDRNFTVDIATTPANCNNQGSIQIDALNVFPNYRYVLRRDDGTLIDDETAQPDNTYTFNVNPGDYIIETSTDDGCFDSQNITVSRIPDPTLSALTTADIGCTAGTVSLTRTGGQGNPDFLYAIWSIDGASPYTTIADIPASEYQVDSTFYFGWRDDDGDGTDEYIPSEDGDYVFVIVDANNCFALSNEVTVNDLGSTVIDSIAATSPSCSGDNDGSLTINVSGGIPPYQYSIDNGATYQPTPNFVNLTAANYNIRVLDSSGCDISQIYNLTEPFPLSASVGVSRDATCDPNGAEVRITNVTGGTAPYTYSFDGGSNFGTSTIAVLPAGTYTVIVRDQSCDFPMAVTVVDVPPPPIVTLTPSVSYDCSGTGDVTVTPNISTYNYQYALDGVLNTPDPTSNTFNDLPVGNYVVTTYYVPQTPPTPSLLLSEDFGTGGTIPNPNTTGYAYEPQVNDGIPSGSVHDNGFRINDLEYAVTNSIVGPFGAWINPTDHTAGDPNGRYLVINVGDPPPGSTIYRKAINDIIPNRPITVSLFGINLIASGGRIPPDLTIQLRNPATDAIVAFEHTGPMPEDGQWNEYALTLNPGTFTSLDLVIVTNEIRTNGNDVAIDDIAVFQIPEVCEQSIDTPVSVEAGNQFAASVTSFTNATCNGLSDGTITFEVENFDAVAGFQYSVDGGSTYFNSTTSPVTTPAVYGAGNQTVEIRRADDTSCTLSISQTIVEPPTVVASASVTTMLSCTNGGATITANGSGGTPTYLYQLEDTAGTPITGYDFATNGTNRIFTAVAAGDYNVRVRDASGCEDVIDAILTVSDTNNVVFDTTFTECYSGANDATIEVAITDGNGDYTFNINGGPWIVPSPASATSYIFQNLASGTYTVNVRDGAGCIGTPETITIDPAITVSASAPPISACATSTTVTLSTSGGNGSFQFAIVPDGTTPTMPDYNSSTVRTISAPGDYDVYLRNPSGGPSACTAFTEITITQDDPIVITPTATPTVCFGESNGSISLAVVGGTGPFEYSIDNGTNYQTGTDFVNLSAGTYPIRVRDANNCEQTVNVTVNQPAQLVAEAIQTQTYTCNQLGQITVGSITPTIGGSDNFQYSINGGGWTPSTTGGHIFVDLTDGTYSIRVRDANAISCEITLPDVIIAPLPTEPTLTTSVAYNCDGTGNITVLPSDPSYTYQIGASAFQTNNVFNNIAVGTYTITVNYGSDCTVDTTVIVEDGNAFEATITAFENLDCNADSSGTITIAAANFGASGFEYSLDGFTTTLGSSTTSPVVLNGLSAQAYTITVRDVANPIAGCTIPLNQTLTEPAPVVASASVTALFSCNNMGATITASATGGTPTYEYQLEDNVGGVITAYQTGTTFTNVVAGDYLVRARDTNGCSDPIDTALTVLAPANPTFTTSPTACYSGANDGSIQVDVIAGNGDYQFSINAGPWLLPTPTTATTYTFNNLTNGTYTIDVRDGFGCTAIQQLVTLNPQLRATATLQSDLTCLVDASISVDAVGGSGTYTYEWGSSAAGPWNTSGFVGNVYTTNTSGTYYFRVTDTTAPTVCTVVSNNVSVTPIVPPVITSITPTNLTCNGDNSGVLDILIDTSSGLAPFDIEVLNTTTTNNYGTQTSGLAAGNYQVTVTDAKGCTVSDTATITEPGLINYSVSSVPITCDALGTTTNPGSITITGVTGGTAEYIYYLTANNGIPTQTYTTTSAARDHTFNILNFGIYQIDIIDANGCNSFSTEIIASPPNDLDIDVSTSTANCTDGGTAIVTVGASVGSGDYSFAVLETFTPPYSSNYVSPDVPGGSTATFSSTTNGIFLTPGIQYTFVVYDNVTNCYYFEQSALPIDSPSNMTATLDAIANVSCTGSANGNISFTFDNYDAAATAVDYEIFNSQSNLTTGINGSILVSGPVGPTPANNIGTLPPGEYYLLLTEVNGPYNGCSVFGGEFTIRESVNALDGNVTITKNDNCNLNAGVITANGIFGTAPYEYQLLPTGATSPVLATWAGSSNNVFNVEGGSHEVYIKDAYNCIWKSNPIVVPTDPSPEISLSIVDECAAEGSYEVLVTLDQAGSQPYSLSVNGSAFQNIVFNGSNEYTITGLSSSSSAQTVEIQDLNGCGESENFTIYPKFQATATVTGLLDCIGTGNAEITITATDGSGNFQYEINGPVNESITTLPLSGSPSPTHSAVWNNANVSGTYTVSIYDVNSSTCPIVIPLEIPDALVPVLTIDSFDNVSCNGADDGTITVSAADNGVGPYTFEIISGPGSTATFPIAATSNTATTATFTGLEGSATPGITYTIRATASNGCTTDIIQAIEQPDAIANVNATVLEFFCTTANNQNNATISIDDTAITGGSGTYAIYEFINDQGTAAPGDDVVVQSGSNTVYTETNTAGGTYIINVYDDNGCLGTTTAAISEFIEISNPTVTVTQDITCNPGNDAEVSIGITLNPGSGTPNLAYTVVGTDNAYSVLNQTSNVFTALGIGNYLVTVTNTDTSCFVETTFEIEDPNNLEITPTTVDVICFGDDGSVSFTINDPVNAYTGGFTWQIYDSQGTAILADDVLITGANGVSANVGPTAPFAIGAGEYRVDVTQSADPSCVQTEFFTIAGPSETIAADTQVTPVTCVGNDGIIEIIDVVGGWGGHTYFVDLASNPAPTYPASYQTSPIFGSLAGGATPGTDYQVWVADQNGCTFRLPDVTLVAPTLISASLQINQPNCTNFEGEIEVISVLGGQGSNYTYQLIKDGTPTGAPQNTTVFSGLDAGSYEVEITDQWSCTFTTDARLLYAPIVPLATVVKTIDCTASPGGEITITQTGGSGSFNYDVTYPDGITTASNTTGVFIGLTQVGDYTFVITDQAVGHRCTSTIVQGLDAAVIPYITVDSFTDVDCNGADNGSITVSTVDSGVGPYLFEIISGPGSTATFPITASASTPTTATFDNLEGLTGAGITYTIQVTAANGCSTTTTQVITQPEIIDTINVSVTEFLCNSSGNNESNAALTIDVPAITGGSGNYTRFVFINNQGTVTTADDIVVQDGPNAVYTETDFAGGDYTIVVYDDQGCSNPTAVTATIAPFDQLLSASTALTGPALCAGEDIRIDVTGSITDSSTPAGLANYQFRELPSGPWQASNLFTGLSVGVHVFEVQNINTGCVITATHVVQDPNTFDIVINKISDAQCHDGDGEIQLSITDATYTGGFNYQIFDTQGTPGDRSDDGAFIEDGLVSNLGPSGSIFLPGGTYLVEISQTGAPQCVKTSTFTINAPIPLTLDIAEEAGVSCSNDEGSISVNPQGGVGPYTIQLTNTTTSQVYTQTGVSAYIFTDLSERDFMVTVTDALGCVRTGSISLIRPENIDASLTSSPITCFNGNNGSVTASFLPRTQPLTPIYEYRLNSYGDSSSNTPQQSAAQSIPVFNGLSAGFYSVIISDDAGCADESNIVQIVNPTEVRADLIRTSPLTCTTGVEFLLTASGGTGPYEYYDSISGSWQPMAGGNTQPLPPAASALIYGAGDYSFMVRDANQCASILSNEITEDPIENLSLEVDRTAAVVNCNGEATGAIYAQADGGLGNYRYSLFTDAALTNNYYGAGADQTDGEFRNLPAGTYYVNVVSEDCTTNPEMVEIIEPPILEVAVDVVDASCFGEEDGSITVTLSGGAGGYQYAISPNLNQFTDENTFDELAPGTYTIIAQDQNGCFLELEETIVAPDLLEVVATALPEICEGNEDGSISLVITGGTAPYRTALNSNTEADFVPNRMDFPGLAGGNYIVIVRDANDCETNIVVEVEAGVNLNATVEPIYECTGDTPDNYVNINLEDTSILGDVLYALDSTDPADMQLNPDFRNTPAGSHYIAIAHSNGCINTLDFEIEGYEPLTLILQQQNINEITALAEGGRQEYTFYFDDINNGSDNTYRINRTDTYTVRVVDENGCEASATIFMEFIDIDIPNFFTPSDGDGLNDTWKPRNDEGFPEILTIIFDRYGREIYRMGMGDPGWDGLYLSKELPSGDYWYIIKLNGESDEREFVGHFTLYR